MSIDCALSVPVFFPYVLHDMVDIAENLKRVQTQIGEAALRCGRDPNSVSLVVVTKTFPPEAILEAYAAGAKPLGENRVQEALKKVPAVQKTLESSGSPSPKWHLIGHLQRNKVRHVFGLFDCVQSADSLRLLEILEKTAVSEKKTMPVYLEVNLAGEEAKSGCRPNEAELLVKKLENSSHLQLEGLMTIPPFSNRAEESRTWFRMLRELRDQLVEAGYQKAKGLSMGMTNDFEVAIEEGATIVRVGKAIFGSRN